MLVSFPLIGPFINLELNHRCPQLKEFQL
jgi:hypothetical protein